MPYIITEPCVGVKDKSCTTVCPVDCIYEGEDMLYIHPDECIDCGLCEPECPVNAIFVDSDVPSEWTHYIELNERKAKEISGHS
jgi:NAD-dependent dihydropyrimidine dehydrogenase PreA subunit